MEASVKKTKTTKSQSDTKAQIIDAYMDYVLTENKMPATVFAFCKHIGISESEYYQHFNSFEQIEEQQWVQLYQNTKAVLHNDEVYASFSIREKMLSFYFTWLEQLKNKRSFAQYYAKKNESRMRMGKAMDDFRKHFKEDTKSLIIEGVATGEIADRSKLTDRYDDLFWMVNMFVLNFWLKDQSSNFEKTDAAVEKAVNLAFDLIAKGALESLFDFGKFMFQERF